MKTKLMTLAAAAALVAACGPAGSSGEGEEASDTTETMETTDASAEQEGWITLFDGSDTDAWKAYCGEEVPGAWTIEDDGTLKINGSGRGEAGAKDGGDIITKEKYGNFELELEWKASKGGNSGIFYLAQEKCGEDGQQIWKSSPEMQVLDNKHHPDAMAGDRPGSRSAGALYDLIVPEPLLDVEPGTWVKAKVKVYKGTVWHYINDQEVLEYHLWTDEWKEMVANSKFADYEDFVDPAAEGHIGLQDHGDDVWFRNVRIKPL